MKILTEPKPGVFGSTKLSEALIIPEYRDCICAPYVIYRGSNLELDREAGPNLQQF